MTTEKIPLCPGQTNPMADARGYNPVPYKGGESAIGAPVTISPGFDTGILTLSVFN